MKNQTLTNLPTIFTSEGSYILTNLPNVAPFLKKS